MRSLTYSIVTPMQFCRPRFLLVFTAPGDIHTYTVQFSHVANKSLYREQTCCCYFPPQFGHNARNIVWPLSLIITLVRAHVYTRAHTARIRCRWVMQIYAGAICNRWPAAARAIRSMYVPYWYYNERLAKWCRVSY